MENIIKIFEKNKGHWDKDFYDYLQNEYNSIGLYIYSRSKKKDVADKIIYDVSVSDIKLKIEIENKETFKIIGTKKFNSFKLKKEKEDEEDPRKTNYAVICISTNKAYCEKGLIDMD